MTDNRNHMTIDGAATILLAAEDERRDRPPLTEAWTNLDLAQAYAIQSETLRRRLARGESLVGLKLGLTSRAKQMQMGVSSPIIAWLTDEMPLPAGASLRQEKLIHPRAEPEIVFVMGERLAGPGVTAASVLRAVASVRAGVEIIDSRYTNFRFTLPDVVADNASAAKFVLGAAALPPSALDLASEECVLKVNGKTVASATGADVQGQPAEAVALAVNELAERNLAVEAGWIVMTGGMTDAVFIPPRTTISADFTNLGIVSIYGGD